MKVVLLITVTLALTLVYWKYQPRQRNSNNNVCNTFDKKYILQEIFNRNSKTKSDEYLSKNGFCDKETDQQSVERVCNGDGRHDSDLCISGSTMLWNSQPCQSNTDIQMYNRVLEKHSIQGKFDRTSKSAWAKYLWNNELCGRLYRATQTFFESKDQRRVEQICGGRGYWLNRNLCISDSPMPLYVLKVRPDCTITNLDKTTEKVVVACDKIRNQCRPVHFQMSINQNPAHYPNRCI